MTRADLGPRYSTRVDDALALAAEAFRTHIRKATNVPYLTHLLAVCALVGEHGGDEDQLIAALLHDYLEDVPGTSADDLAARSQGLIADAEAWARAWADTVNRINQQRRDDAVERERNSRGFGEQFVDIFHGDDSDQQVRPVELVSVPTAESRYAATGGLEEF